MNQKLSKFNGTVVKFARPVLISMKTVVVGSAGAALAGGATAAQQYVATNGATQDWKAVGSAAAAGAIGAGVAYFLNPPTK